MKKKSIFLFLLGVVHLSATLFSQDHHDHSQPSKHTVKEIDPQPLLAQAVRLNEALSFLGSSLSAQDQKKLTGIQQRAHSPQTVKQIQDLLDPYCLAIVNINPEARVKVERGRAAAGLIQGGWKSFLVKVNNDAGVTAQLQPESPNAAAPVHRSSNSPRVMKEDVISAGEVANRFIDIQLYRNRPMQSNLSGMKLEYAVLQIYSKDAGSREVEIGFNVGQGSQDIGFRNTIHILFDIKPSVKVRFDVKDEDGSPAMASFVITDGIERTDGGLENIYPLPSRRVASYDEYPDFFFQKQVYRSDGEFVSLPPGKYTISFTRGPEYIPQTKQVTVPAGKNAYSISFGLKRWINMARLGWYSADHHVHAAGCSHYDSPEEGIPPRDMWRQALGEDLGISAVLTWGPSWYEQKKYFTGKDDSLSTDKNIMRYDVEVSGFPSSHCGHIVLLRLKEDDYPGTASIEEWPTWTLPILKWAKSQGGVVGYAHSGWGLEPMNPTTQLPNYELPKMDGIGANEYIVAVTQDLVDFYSAGDTPAKDELNMWYHTLNCGYRVKLSGETDFPCITDQRVGKSRSYFRSGSQINFDDYVDAIKRGGTYMSEGGTHLMKFAVNGQETGANSSELKMTGKPSVKITADVAAYLVEARDSAGEIAANKLVADRSYWNIERSRIGNTRNIAVELIVNGNPVDTALVVADGKTNKISFDYTPDRSCWVAIRVMYSAHSNPVFIELDGKPVREKRSAEWCRKSVDQCWKMKEPNIRKEEKAEAREAYDHARTIYDLIIRESQDSQK